MMKTADAESKDEIKYKVVVNHEEQYSIWPYASKIPAGWKELPVSGNKEQCLAHIAEVWTDMRPLCIRKKTDL